MNHNRAAGKRHGKTPPVITLVLVLLAWAALGAGLAWFHGQQQQSARAQAHQQASTVAARLAAELAGHIRRDQQVLAKLDDNTPRPDSTIQVRPQGDNTRLTWIPDKAPVNGLSFTERDLLRQLRENGKDTIAAQGGDRPALLIAHDATTGSVILTRDLTPWLAKARQSLPTSAGLALAQGSLTLVHLGAHSGTHSSAPPRASATGGPITVTVTMTPQPTPALALLPFALLGAVLLAAAIIGALWLRTRRQEAHGAHPPRHAEPSPQPQEAHPAEPASRRSVAPPAPPAPATTPASPEPPPLHAAAEAAGKALPETLFRGYDVRGVVGDALTPEAVALLGQAIGSVAAEAGQQTVFVARDGRLSSPALSQALIDGLTAAGRQVVDLGLQPTPILHFATETQESGSGVCVTGSHNPPQYNGLKIVIDGETLHGERLTALRQRIAEGRLERGRGSVEERDITPLYQRALRDDIVLARPMRIAVDCGNGATGPLAPGLFQDLGCKVVTLHGDVDGHFPHHHPDPADSANLQALADTVRQQKLDLGLAFDGDGDRLGVVTSDGQIIWPDRLLMLFARDLLQRNPGADVIFDVKCSRALQTLIRKQGGRPVMYKTGRPLIQALMKETGASLAGEMSGHLFFADRWFGFDDALYAGARLLEILSQEQGDSATVFADLQTGPSTPELSIPADETRQFEIMDALCRRADRFPGGRATTIDGLRVDFPDGWGLVRASNTMPALVCRFEGRDPPALERVQALFHDQLKAVDDTLRLPF